jgi:superfamily II DNA/RNA helicase
MNRIRLKLVKIIVCTDVLSRGIDLEAVDVVINFSDPYSPENYFHRIGRTARYGQYGVSFLLMNSEKKSAWLRESKHYSKKKVNQEKGMQLNEFNIPNGD